MADLSLRLADIQAKWRYLYLFAAGIAAALGQAPIGFLAATLLGLMVAIAAHKAAANPGQAFLQGWVFGLGYFAFALRWIIEPFLVDIARHGWMAPFALVLMGAGGGLFWAIAAYLAKRFAPRNMALFALALVWAEITRSYVFTGFPWVLLGHSLIDTPLVQLAAFGGPHLLTAIVCLMGYLLARPYSFKKPAHGYGVVAAAVATLGACVLILSPGPADQTGPDAPVVRVVQPNAPQHQKWDPAYRDIFLQRLIDDTVQGPVPDFVVWPETSVPTLLNYIEDDMTLLADAARGVPLVFGIQRTGDASQFHNSLVLMGPDGRVSQTYDKRHLVPFGEYVPGAALIGRAGMTGLARNLGSGFTPGQSDALINIPGVGAGVPLICYEGIFAEEIYRGPERPRLLLLITNDAWFGQAAGPYQHLAQARLRAIEHGLPMVRAANTGISAVIDGKGRIIEDIALGVDGWIDVPLPPALSVTPYVRFGDLPIIVLLILLTGTLYLARSRNSD